MTAAFARVLSIFALITTLQLIECCEVEEPTWLGDRYCDKTGGYNTPECDFDGGDCCESTCQSATCGSNGYQCIENCTAEVLAYIVDGWCDREGGYNTQECAYDGGDCCETTCSGGDCGDNGYDCRVCEGDLSNRGNGRCDADLNMEHCDWDSGDCCPSSCVDGDTFTCGDPQFPYDCKDPSECLTQPVDESFLGDGFCDSHLNTAPCNFDEGDCCVESCQEGASACGTTLDVEQSPGEFYTIGGYRCVDPAHSPCEVPHVPLLGDGFCHGGPYNTEECQWDFGDCCEETCDGINFDEYTTCGNFPYDCLDPLLNRSSPTGPFSNGDVIRLGALRSGTETAFLGTDRREGKEVYDQVEFLPFSSDNSSSWWIVDIPGLNAYPGTFTLRPFTDPDRYLHRAAGNRYYRLGLHETPDISTPFAHSATWYWEDPFAEGDGIRISMSTVKETPEDVVRVAAFGQRLDTGLRQFTLEAVTREVLGDSEADLLDGTFRMEFVDLGPATPAPPSPVPTDVPTSAPTAQPSSTPTEMPTALPSASPSSIPTQAPTSISTALPSSTPTQVPTQSPSGAPTLSPTTGNSSAVAPPPTSTSVDEDNKDEDEDEEAVESSDGSSSSLSFGEILSIALGIALVFAVAGIFAVRQFVLYQRKKDSNTLTPRAGRKDELRKDDEEGVEAAEEFQPGAAPKPKKASSTHRFDPGSATTRRDGDVEMVERNKSQKTLLGPGGKRSSVMNVVLGENAIDSRSNSDNEKSAKTSKSHSDDEKSVKKPKSKSEEWFGNPEVLEDVILESLLEAKTSETSMNLLPNEQPDNKEPTPVIDQAPAKNIEQSPELHIDHAPSSAVPHNALTAALGLAPGELFKSEAELLQRVQALLQPEGGSSPRTNAAPDKDEEN